MRRIVFWAFLLLLGSGVLGATVFQGQIAGAAGEKQARPTAQPTQTVREQNLDTNGFIRTHEQGTADVNVTNATVPVSGSVDVATMPNVKLDPTGNTVKIDPANNTVAISSSQTSPVSVSNVNDGQNPFEHNLGQAWAPGDDHACTPASFPIPTGKTFVEETVSLTVQVPTGTVLKEAIVIENLESKLYLVPVRIGSDGTTDYYAASEQVRNYVAAGRTIRICAFATAPVSAAGAIGMLDDGYLLNTP
jgi:hypothetical protein